MSNPKVKFKRSSVSGKRPTVDNVELGEIALNTYDGRLYTLQDTGGIGIGTTTTLLTPWQESYGGGTITYSGNVNLDDNDKLQLGDDQDLQIYHNGSHSYIDDAGTGNLYLRSGTLSIQNLAGTKTSAVFNSGSSQELYFNNNKRFETSNHGAIVTGILTATSFSGGIVAISTTAPSSPADGALWYNPDYGRTAIYYDDGSSSQWVDSSPVVGGTAVLASLDISGITTTASLEVTGNATISDKIIHSGDTDTAIRFPAADTITAETGGSERLRITSAGDMGLGTSSPTNISNFTSFTLNGTTGGNIEFKDDNTLLGSIYNLADQFIVQAQGSSTPLAFRTNSAERMRIDSSGNISLGTSTVNFPSGKGFQIYDSSTPRLKLANSTTGTASGDGSLLYVSGSDFLIENKENANMRFYTSATERMRIDSSGQVYIGGTSGLLGKVSVLTTGTTDTSLHLATTGGASSNGDATNSVRFTGGTNSRWANAKYEAFNHLFHGNGVERMRLDSSGNLQIAVTGGDSTSGRISIGNNSADGTVDFSQGLQFLDTYNNNPHQPWSHAGICATGSTGYAGNLVFGTDPGGSQNQGGIVERMRIDSSGNVGIGTDSPGDYLASSHQLVISDSASTGLTIATPTTSSGTIAFADGTGAADNARGLIRYGHSDNSLQFSTNATERMRIDSSGRMGINTTNPTSFLQVGNNPNGSTLTSGGGALSLARNGDTFLEFWTTGGSQSSKILFNQNGTEEGSIEYVSDTMRFAVNQAERMRIDSSGRLGLGTASPSANLHVASSGDTEIKSESTGDNALISINNSSSVPWILTQRNDTTNGLSFRYNGNNYVNIDTSGRLLVGTSTSVATGFNQGATIQVFDDTASIAIRRGANDAFAPALVLGKTRSTTDGSFTIVQNNDSLGAIRFAGDDGTDFQTQGAKIQCFVDGTPGANDMPGRLVFSTTADGSSSPAERMRVTSSGDVLIGTTTASNSSGTGVKLRVDTASVDLVFDTSSNVNLNHVYNSNATRNGYRYYLSLDGGIRNFSSNNVNLSDEREKKNIVDMDSTWSDLKQWTLRQFHFNDQNDSEDKRYGVIAQQIETVSPQVLSTFEINPTTVRKGVKETQMMWMAIKALQEAQDRIETLEARVAALE